MGWKRFHTNINQKSRSSNTHIRYHRLQKKDCYKRQGRTLCNNQGINPRMRYNLCVYVCVCVCIYIYIYIYIYTHIPHIGVPQYIRQMLTSLKGEIYSNTVIVGDFHTPLKSMNSVSRENINKETHMSNTTLGRWT